MKYFNYSLLQNIVCLDIKNATNKDLFTWLSLNETTEITKSHIEYLIKKNNSETCESKKTESIYLQNNFIIAKSFENYQMNLCFSEFFMDELKNLPVIKNKKAKEFINLFMDNLMTNDKWDMKEYYFMNLIQYQENKNYSNNLFLNQTIAFDVSEYNLRLKEILNPKKFKPAYCELKRLYPEMKIVCNFIVQKMYYHKQLAIAFSAKLTGTDIEQWFWSDHFEESLLFIKPIPLVVPECELTINAILDKINEYGLPYLTTNEIKFLEKFNSNT